MSTLRQTIVIVMLASGLIATGHADERKHRSDHWASGHFAPQREIHRAVEYRNEFRRREHRHHDHHEARPDLVRIVVNPWLVNTRYATPLRVVRLPPPTPEPVWYFCANPMGYFPYVDRCHVTWQAVQANSWSGLR